LFGNPKSVAYEILAKMSQIDLHECYRLLNLEPGASTEEIQTAYLQKVSQLLRQGAKEEVKQLKSAHAFLRDYALQKEHQEAKENTQQKIIELVTQRLQSKRIQAQIRIQGEQLRIIVDVNQFGQSQIFKEIIYLLLEDLELRGIQIFKIYGVKRNGSIVWKDECPVSSGAIVAQRSQRLLKQGHRNINTFAFPIAIVIAIALNSASLFPLWSMWIHELGHASVAWLAGHHALPTFAATIVSLERSLFVYFGILILLGLLFWSSWREKKPWTMGLAVSLTLLQFYMTWLLSPGTFEMILAFGGIGGEFYLSTFFMVCFYFPLPDRWRWDFWRYIVLVLSASTFLESFSMWHRISTGQEAIPWGTFWGGRGDSGGDMDILAFQFGWSDRTIIDTYKNLGNICGLLLLGVYLYFLIKNNPQFITSFMGRKPQH
jgi:hypothetical protein